MPVRRRDFRQQSHLDQTRRNRAAKLVWCKVHQTQTEHQLSWRRSTAHGSHLAPFSLLKGAAEAVAAAQVWVPRPPPQSQHAQPAGSSSGSGGGSSSRSTGSYAKQQVIPRFTVVPKGPEVKAERLETKVEYERVGGGYRQIVQRDEQPAVDFL